MTRARARALENEVTSFLSDITYDPLETWLLPKSDMLCMIRCQEEPPEDAREDGQAAKFTDEENQRKRASSPSRPRTSGPWSNHSSSSPDTQAYRARTSGPSPEIRPKARTSGATLQNIQKFCPPTRTSGPQPRHPASPEAPDISPVARTSGHPCLRTVRAEARVPLRPPRLYILLLLHLSRVSIGLAHM